MQAGDSEFSFAIDQIALREARNSFRILVSQGTAAEQSCQKALLKSGKMVPVHCRRHIEAPV
jgi:hypothetical protein